jgi:hypothetical protein
MQNQFPVDWVNDKKKQFPLDWANEEPLSDWVYAKTILFWCALSQLFLSVWLPMHQL